MKQIIFNKDFSGTVTIFGEALSGKSHLAGLIAQKIILSHKNVLWINSEDTMTGLKRKIYGNIPRYKALTSGQIYIVNLNPMMTLTPEVVKEMLTDVLKVNNEINTVVVEDLYSGDYRNDMLVFEMFQSFCYLHNMHLICTFRSRTDNIQSLPAIILQKTDFCYMLNTKQSDLYFEDFKLERIKDHPAKEDIFVTDENKWIYI